MIPSRLLMMKICPFGPTPKRMSARVADLHHQQARRSEEHTSELQSHSDLVCRLLLEKKKKKPKRKPGSYKKRRIPERGSIDLHGAHTHLHRVPRLVRSLACYTSSRTTVSSRRYESY